jgi:hypothetical protein
VGFIQWNALLVQREVLCDSSGSERDEVARQGEVQSDSSVSERGRYFVTRGIDQSKNSTAWKEKSLTGATNSFLQENRDKNSSKSKKQLDLLRL